MNAFKESDELKKDYIHTPHYIYIYNSIKLHESAFINACAFKARQDSNLKLYAYTAIYLIIGMQKVMHSNIYSIHTHQYTSIISCYY